MDWLDQYLHELDRPGAMMHFPPDKPSWNAPVPSKQQMALIQDATVADMVRVRIIQEARQAEIDAGMGGAYDAGSAAGQTAVTSPVVPSGIPVSTQTIVVTNNLQGFNGTYSKSPSTPLYWIHNQYVSIIMQFNNGSWEFYDTESAIGLNNPSNDANYIPTTGWTSYGSPVTITISVFGLPASITISGAVGGSTSANGTFNKTNQDMGYLAASTNGSYNYYNMTYPNVYITSPANTNSNGDYNYAGWVMAFSADGAYFLMANPSTDKFNFPTTGWVYSSGPYSGPNSAGQSGPASLTITAA